MNMQTLINISGDFYKLIQSAQYEMLILELMNKSNYIFPYTYKHNNIQNNGQCDFVDIDNGEKYEAKLLINEEQGRLIGSRNGNIEEWLILIINESFEYNNNKIKDKLASVQELKLYTIIKHLLEKIKKDENAIFFIPFPVVLDRKNAFFMQFQADILKNIYDELNNQSIIGDRKIYTIYPSIDKNFVLRNLAGYRREYLPSIELDKYIKYESSII